MTAGTVVWRGSSSLTWGITAAWRRPVVHRGGVTGVTGGTEVAPFQEHFSTVMAGLFTEVSSRCSLFFHHLQPLFLDAVRNFHPFHEPPPGFYDLFGGHRCCYPWRLFRGLRLQPTAATSVGAVSHAW